MRKVITKKDVSITMIFLFFLILSFLAITNYILKNNNVYYSLNIKKPIEEKKEKDWEFELPINGSSGYSTIDIKLKKDNNINSETITTIKRGVSFTILDEKDNWWQINYQGEKGWIDNTFCMINLPDIIPSIIYDASNSYSSLFKSSGYNIPNITDQKLYDVKMYNYRLEKDEFVMPVLYPMAKKINEAQQLALKNGDSLKIYESYRPRETQRSIVINLKELTATNVEVYNGININSWSETWFIYNGLSNHQLGAAIDVSLVKIDTYIVKEIGSYTYIDITNYEEYTMPSPMHELSAQAVTFKYGVSPDSKTAWKKVPLVDNITEGAVKLQNYCVESGLTPISSEWWHFNDLDSKDMIKGSSSKGDYYLSGCSSQKINK